MEASGPAVGRKGGSRGIVQGVVTCGRYGLDGAQLQAVGAGQVEQDTGCAQLQSGQPQGRASLGQGSLRTRQALAQGHGALPGLQCQTLGTPDRVGVLVLTLTAAQLVGFLTSLSPLCAPVDWRRAFSQGLCGNEKTSHESPSEALTSHPTQRQILCQRVPSKASPLQSPSNAATHILLQAGREMAAGESAPSALETLPRSQPECQLREL